MTSVMTCSAPPLSLPTEYTRQFEQGRLLGLLAMEHGHLLLRSGEFGFGLYSGGFAFAVSASGPPLRRGQMWRWTPRSNACAVLAGSWRKRLKCS